MWAGQVVEAGGVGVSRTAVAGRSSPDLWRYFTKADQVQHLQEAAGLDRGQVPCVFLLVVADGQGAKST